MDCSQKQDVELAEIPSNPPTDHTDPEDKEEEEYDGDLNDDLHDALSEEYDFTGSYYHRSIEPNAPNPGLKIEGVGLIGLPLSDRDATTIISQAAQAPFGKGEQTVVDTTVRDTWEMEPTNVSFLNPQWQAFIDEVAFKKVWTTLGVKPYSTKPRCELYKLLLYQTGSHFLPHQDTAKADGMFATVIVVLPSAYEGGQVHLSHAGQSTVLDVSQGSCFNTSVLAWYTDVIHEVKPITSGYRLALSYNLIHTSTNSPKPSLPGASNGALDALRETLQRWKDSKYHISEELDYPLYAYMLSHQYSENDLDRGTEALKGKDAHLVSLILPLAEEMDFVICLAKLSKTETGYADDHGGYYHKRGRWYDDSDEDEEDTPGMAEVEETTHELSHMVRLSPMGVVNLGMKRFNISEEAIVPRDAFEDMSPDNQDYEGYQGNGAGSLSQWYHRSALVLFRKADETLILMSISGPSAVLRALPLTDSPTPAAKEIVATVLSKLSDSTSAITIANHAILWKEHEIWNKAVPFIGPLEAISSSTTEALKVFEPELIQPGLSQLVQQRPGLQARLDLIKAISVLLPGGTTTAWIHDLTKNALSSYSAASVTDVSALIQLAQEVEGGVVTLANVVIPKTSAQANSYDFHVAVTEALNQKRKQLADSNSDVAEINAIQNLIRQCLLAASLQWSTPPPPPPATAYYAIRHNPTLSPTVLAERVNYLIKLCLSVNNPDLCIQIAQTVGVDRQMDVLNAIRSHAGNADSTWVKDLMQTVISAYSIPAVSHIPTLSWIAETLGPEHIKTLVSTKIPKSGTYDFLLALAKSLHERLSLILQNQDTTEERKTSFHAAIISCVLAAIPQWELGLNIAPQYNYLGLASTSASNSSGPNVKVKRILELVDFFFAIGDLSPCSALFTNVLQIQPNVNVPARFKELHTPLVPHLKATLKKHGKSLMFEPFRSFFKGTISLYLGRVLGVIPLAPYPALPTRPIGCGCSDCNQLKNWLSTSTPKIEFKAAQPARTHLEKQINQAKISHIVTYDTTKRGTPYTLVVSKRNEIMAGLRWKEAQAAALEFVQVVGDNDQNLRELMQDRYDDMIKSFSGTRTFVVGQLNITDATTSTPVAGPSGSSNAPTVVPGGVAPVAGSKRKHRNPPTNVIDVIDLT